MEKIEEKERLLEQKEELSIQNSYKDIKLSDEKQAKVDKKKKELEEMLANMLKLESEFDEIDAAEEFEKTWTSF